MATIIGHAAMQKRYTNLHSSEGMRVKHIIENALKNDDKPEVTADKILQVIFETSRVVGFEGAVQHVAYCIKENLNHQEAKVLNSYIYKELEGIISAFK